MDEEIKEENKILSEKDIEEIEKINKSQEEKKTGFKILNFYRRYFIICRSRIK